MSSARAKRGPGVAAAMAASDDEVEVVEAPNFNVERTTRSQDRLMPKYEREDLQNGLVNCPECGRGVFCQDGCKTVACRDTRRHESGRCVYFCLFCKKRCETGRQYAICDCPWWNSSDNREIVHAQLQQPVDLCGSEEEGGEDVSSSEPAEGATATPSSDVSSDDAHENERLDSDDESWHWSGSEDERSDDSFVVDDDQSRSEPRDGDGPPGKRLKRIKIEPAVDGTDEGKTTDEESKKRARGAEKASGGESLGVKMEGYNESTDDEEAQANHQVAKKEEDVDTDEEILSANRCVMKAATAGEGGDTAAVSQRGGVGTPETKQGNGNRNQRKGRKTFEEKLAELTAYKEEHGHLKVKWREDRSLAKFCVHIRQAGRGKRRMKLTAERIAALDALGFDWAPQVKEQPFQERVEELKEYKATHRHLNVTRSEDKSLYNFCQTIRRAGRGKGTRKLTAERIAALDALGFDWAPQENEQPFQERVEELKEYKATHRHLNVTRSEDKSLNNFCCKVRQARRGKGTMKLTQDRIDSLDALGFVWTPQIEHTRANAFQERVDELRAYKRKHGHIKVKESEDKSLYLFCKNIRRARTGKGNMKLTEDRIASLDALGFDWEPRGKRRKLDD